MTDIPKNSENRLLPLPPLYVLAIRGPQRRMSLQTLRRIPNRSRVGRGGRERLESRVYTSTTIVGTPVERPKSVDILCITSKFRSSYMRTIRRFNQLIDFLIMCIATPFVIITVMRSTPGKGCWKPGWRSQPLPAGDPGSPSRARWAATVNVTCAPVSTPPGRKILCWCFSTL